LVILFNLIGNWKIPGIIINPPFWELIRWPNLEWVETNPGVKNPFGKIGRMANLPKPKEGGIKKL